MTELITSLVLLSIQMPTKPDHFTFVTKKLTSWRSCSLELGISNKCLSILQWSETAINMIIPKTINSKNLGKIETKCQNCCSIRH